MSSSPLPDSSSDLRRSKRNKFHLDVTTMHLMNPERRKQASSASPLPRDNNVGGPPTLSPQIAVKKRKTTVEGTEDEEEDESRERTTETTQVVQKGVKRQKGTSSNGRERNKPHKCLKCPSSFDSTISLDLHVSLHGSSKKHRCLHCDYSSNSLHAVRTHTRMHGAALSAASKGALRVSSSVSPVAHSSTSVSSSSMDSIAVPLSIAITQDESSSPEGMDEDEETPSPVPSSSQAGPSGIRLQSTFNGKYKCPVCPFTTRDNERLERHNYGHSRVQGFICPLCTFKSESAGFLKRHVDIHGVREYPWPPQYVGISPRMNGIIEKNEKEGSPTNIPIGKVLKAAHNASIPREKIGEAVSALQTLPLISLKPSPLVPSVIGEGADKGISTHSGWKEKMKRGKRWRKDRLEKCTEKDCKFNTRSKARAAIHRIQKHWNKKVLSRRLCGECGMRLNGEGAKRIHWHKHHRIVKWSTKTMKKYKDERCGGKNEVEELPILFREKYACDECPFSSAVRSKLDRHQTKHKIKEDFKCSNCSFSCRTNDLLQSHQRYHSSRVVERGEREGGIPSTPTPTMDRVDSDSPPALERAESSMGEGDEMPLLESVGTPPVLEMEVEMKEEKNKKNRGGRKRTSEKMVEEVVEKRQVEQLRLIEKAVRIRNVGVIGIKRTGGESKRRYKCIHCPFTASAISTLWRHARHHVFTSSSCSSSLHHCSDCTFTTSLLPLFSTHLSMHVQARDTFPCEFCPFVGLSSTALDGHIDWTGHGVPSIPSSLSRQSPVKNESNIRIGGSKGVKPISFNLTSSRKWMKPSNEEKKLLILMNKNKSSRDLQCPECPFSDPSPLIFKLHKEMHEGPTQQFACNVCSYSASSPEGLHHHISLHIPSDTVPLKRVTIRRRHSVESIPVGVSSFDCTSCNFRTLDQTAFHVHKLEHAQLIQQRLVTQIKRAATVDEETKKKSKPKDNPTRIQKQLYCTKCDFVCDTAAAHTRHIELHASGGLFECHICDYSATTKQITDFHIVHHHTKRPMAHLRKQAILAPHTTKMRVSATIEEKVELAGQVFLCELCDTQFIEMRQLLHHWEVDHARRGDEVSCHLALGILPTNRVLTKA